MKQLTIRVLFGVFLLLHPFLSSAQLDDVEVHHVIVSIDTRTYGKSKDSELAEMVLRMIRENKLLRPGDYYSVLQYSAYPSDLDFHHYVRKAFDKNGRDYIYRKVDSLHTYQAVLRTNWEKFSTYHRGENHYSLSSIAKPYSLKTLRTNEILVNKTFILLVSDHQYNGQDFYQEVSFFEQAINNTKTKINKDAIMAPCFDLAREYFMEYKQSLIKQYKPLGDNNNIYIDLYEYIPLSKNIALPSVMYYPPQIEAKRVRGKGYLIELPMKNINTEGFSVKKLVFKAIGGGNEKNEIVFTDTADSVKYEMYCPKDQIDAIEVKAWLNIKDGIYDATVLTPGQSGSPGLIVRVPVTYEPMAKVWRLPLPDWLWLFAKDDQYIAAAIVKTIGWFILGVLAVLGLRRLRYYHPKNSQIHLH